MHARCKTRKKEKKEPDCLLLSSCQEGNFREPDSLLPSSATDPPFPPQEIGARAIKKAEEQKKHIWETEDTSFFKKKPKLEIGGGGQFVFVGFAPPLLPPTLPPALPAAAFLKKILFSKNIMENRGKATAFFPAAAGGVGSREGGSIVGRQ